MGEEQENDNEIGAGEMGKQQEGKSYDGEVGKCGRWGDRGDRKRK